MKETRSLEELLAGIVGRGSVRVVAVAGGSSGGKTTLARRLVALLAERGRPAIHLSTDDYYVGGDRNPRDANGEWDFETIKAIDTDLLADDLLKLVSGREVAERRYDFATHLVSYPGGRLRLAPGGLVVLEGIHALNPDLVPGLDASLCYRVFVVPAGLPENLKRLRFSHHHMRLLRRLVRDNDERGITPEETFRMWPRVLLSEKQWIEPFIPNADIVFDSAIDNELPLLRHAAQDLLLAENTRHPGNPDVEFLLGILSVQDAARTEGAASATKEGGGR